MSKIKEMIKKNPIKSYLILILAITSFYFILLFIFLGIACIPLCNQTNSMLNLTETSHILAIVYTPSSETIINLEFLASIIVLLGGFGGFCYIFFSFCDSYISEKRIIYGFIGFYLIISIIDIFILLLFNFEIIELFFLLGFFIVTLIIARITSFVLDEIENNYENRNLIIKFLRRDEPEPVLSNFFDSISRKIIEDYEKTTFYIFLLLILIVYFGYLMDFNILSIISAILFCLLILHGYSQLVLIKKPSTNIELKKENRSFIFPSAATTASYVTLNNVFILNDNGDFLKILKNNENKSEIIKISKYCICSIQDNDYEIYIKDNPLDKIYKKILMFFIYVIAILFVFLIIYSLFELFFFPTKSNIISLSIFFISLGISIAIIIIIYLNRDKFQNLFNRIFH